MLAKEDEFFAKTIIDLGILNSFQIENIEKDYLLQTEKSLKEFLLSIELLLPWDVEKIESKLNEIQSEIEIESARRKEDIKKRLSDSSVTINKELEQLIIDAREKGASDLHLCVDMPPVVRKFKEISFLSIEKLLNAEKLEKIIFSSISQKQLDFLMREKSLDFCMEGIEIGRIRCCIYKQLDGWEATFRLIPDKIFTFEELKLPEVIRKLTKYQQGLILVTGPTGSGKTTTLAAIIDEINKTREDHIITIEDPIEYVHRSLKCQVTQRQFKDHTLSFENALKASLRQDPDIIMIGEMRSRETMAMAISAAETGHLVLGTMPTSSAVRTINAIIDFFPVDQQGQIRSVIADSLRGIISQQLIPNKIQDGLELAVEILLFDSAVSTVIKQDQLFQLTSIIQTNKASGMIGMDDSLLKLIKNNRIEGKVAYGFAEDKKLFEEYLDSV